MFWHKCKYTAIVSALRVKAAVGVERNTGLDLEYSLLDSKAVLNISTCFYIFWVDEAFSAGHVPNIFELIKLLYICKSIFQNTPTQS